MIVNSESEDNFAAIRLIAALLVVFGHSFPLTGGEGPGYLGSPVSTLAVKVFFVISGYLISESWQRDGHFGRYMQRRALRIFPGLIVLCLLTVLLVGPILTTQNLGAYFSNSASWRYLQNAILYPNYSLPGVFETNFYRNAVNGSLWTLPVEFSMYLLTPLILILPLARSSIWIIALATSIASVWFCRIAVPATPVVLYGSNIINALEMAPYFIWGMVYRIWVPRAILNLQMTLLLVILLPLLITDWPSAEMVSLVLVPYATLSLGHASPAWFSSIGRFGDFSYGTYLYGFLVQQIICNEINVANNHWTNFLIAAPIILLLGVLSWFFVEKPAMRLKPRKKKVSAL